MKKLARLKNAIGRLIGRGDTKLDRSKLVGIYMSQANTKDSYTTDLEQNRQRRHGKYTHNRERA